MLKVGWDNFSEASFHRKRGPFWLLGQGCVFRFAPKAQKYSLVYAHWRDWTESCSHLITNSKDDAPSPSDMSRLLYAQGNATKSESTCAHYEVAA